MEILERLNLSTDGPSIPNLKVGDSINVVIFLELPIETEGKNKKRKNTKL